MSYRYEDRDGNTVTGGGSDNTISNAHKARLALLTADLGPEGDEKDWAVIHAALEFEGDANVSDKVLLETFQKEFEPRLAAKAERSAAHLACAMALQSACPQWVVLAHEEVTGSGVVNNRHRGQSRLTAPLPHHPACGSAPGGSRV
jgi:hypothetical protein